MAKPRTTTTKATERRRDRRLLEIAKEHLFIETLETRKSDSLDFHEVSVWGVEAALREAYAAGYEQAKQDIDPTGSEVRDVTTITTSGTNTTIEIEATEFDSAHAAIQHTHASGRGRAITVQGMYFVVDESVAHRIETEGVEFAYLFDRDGRIITVPVN